MSYTLIIHPSRYTECWRPPTPKEKWKRAQHDIRYERRYGRAPKIFKGELGAELGTIDGFRFIPSKTA